MNKARRIDLGDGAKADFARIAAWTADNFGTSQADLYANPLLRAIDEIAADPFLARSKARDEIMPGVRSMHMAKRGRRGRHLVLYTADETTVTILRVLHDSMEIVRHLPED